MSDDTKVKCDRIVMAAARKMDEQGAPMGMILDRLMTFAAAQAVLIEGSAYTAKSFRLMADQIEDGALSKLDAKRQKAMN